ncbi:MAG: MFS transporter, partial [Methylocella sp.]
PVFSLSLAINGPGIFFMFGAFVFVAQYLQLVAGLTPLEAGLWSLPSAVAFTFVSMQTPKLASRIPAANLIAGGLALSALGFIILVFAWDLYSVVASSIVFFVGFTPVVTLTTDFIVSSAPPARAGIASALSETSSELGGALGIACLGSLLTAIYRSQMFDELPGDLTPELAAAARSTLGGAAEASNRLAPKAGIELLDLARGAFLDGFHITAIVAAVALVILAALTLKILTRGEGQQVGGQ